MSEFLNEQIPGFTQLIKLINETTKSLVKLGNEADKTAKDLDFKSTEGLKQLDQQLKTATTAAKGFIQVEKEKKRLSQENEKATQQQIKTEQQRQKLLVQTRKEEDRVAKEKKRLSQENEKATQQQIKTEQQRQKLLVQTRKEEDRVAKQTKRLAQEAKKLNSEYAKQSKQLNNLRKEYKDLILKEGRATNETRKLLSQIRKLDAGLKKVDADVGQFQRSVGDYKQALAGSLGTIGQFATGAGAISAGVMLAGRAISSAVNIIKDFEQAGANLNAVLGELATDDNLDKLTEDAKRLGASTAFSATEVRTLQTEFAKLGFNPDAIVNATEATLNLAAASGTDLANAAAIAGATLGGFGENADQTGRLVDIMAKGFSTSALDIDNFKESMKVAAPAAKAVGLSIEKTTALLGTLSKAGLTGSVAGTGLSTSLIKLNKAGLTLDEGLKQVTDSSDKLGTATDLVGINAAKAFLALAAGTEITKELEEGLNDAGGAAKEMADKQLGTLEGRLKILNSTWEGLILSLEDGEGAFSNLAKGAIDEVSAALGVLSGNFKSAEDKIHPLALLVTQLKIQFKLLNVPVKIIVGIFKAFAKGAFRVAKALGFVKEDADGVTKSFLNFQKIFLRLPEIIDIVAEETGESLGRIVDAALGLGKALLALAQLDFKKAREGGKEFADAFIAGFEDISEDIPDRINAALRGPLKTGTQVKETGEEIGKDLAEGTGKGFGDNISKSISNGLIGKQQQIVSDIQQAINDATSEEDLIRLNIQLRIEERELERLKNIGKEVTDKLKKQEEDSTNDLILFRKKVAVTLAQERSNDRKKDFEEAKKFEQRKFDAVVEALINETNRRIEESITRRNILLENEELTESERQKIIEESIEQQRQIRNNEFAQIEALQRKEEAFEKARLELRKKNIDESLKLIKKFAESIKEASKEREKLIDNDISASEKREDRLRSLAETRNEDVENNIAFEKRKQTELTAAKEREADKQKRAELVITGLELLRANVASGQTGVQATTTTAAQVLGLLSLLNGFHEGTDALGMGDGANPTLNTGKDDFIIRAHKGERIIPTKKTNELNKYGATTVDKTIDLVKKARLGEMYQGAQDSIIIEQTRFQTNAELLNEIRGLRGDFVGELKDLPKRMPTTKATLNTMLKYMKITESVDGNHETDIYKT